MNNFLNNFNKEEILTHLKELLLEEETNELEKGIIDVINQAKEEKQKEREKAIYIESIKIGNLEEIISNPVPDKEYLQEFLNIAIEYGQLEIVKYLVKNIASLNYIDNYQKSPLSYACKYGHTEIAKFLIEVGATVDFQKNQAIISATESEKIEIFELLINSGADVHAKKDEVFSSIARKNNLELMKYFVSKGVDVSVQNNVAYEIAINYGFSHIVEYIVSIKPELKKSKGTPLTSCIAYKRIKDLEYYINNDFKNDIDLQLALKLAAETGQLEVLKKLINYHGNIHSISNEVLDSAMEKGQTEVCQYLLENHAPTKKDKTLIFKKMAVEKNYDMLELLLRNEMTPDNEKVMVSVFFSSKVGKEIKDWIKSKMLVIKLEKEMATKNTSSIKIKI